jgi:hypothetical protein
MARVASCPQCEHDLLVPDDAEPSALVKCPECRAFFELQHAESRELPAALVVQSHTEPNGPSIDLTEPGDQPNLEDFSSLASLKDELEPISDAELKDDSADADILDFADEEPSADHGSASLRAPQPVDEAQEFKPAGTESHEEAAQRIDQWFRSAKTLSDLPPLQESDLAGQSSDEMLEPAIQDAGDAPIDLGDETETLAEVASDVELEMPADLQNDAAPWDDSQHMDRLLADLEGQSVDTYEPVAEEVPVSDHEEQEHFQPAGAWTPDESLAIPTTPGQPERKRSVVRTLVGSAVGGVIGLALAYYALLWLGPVLHRDKDIDFLQVAQYLPKSILPPAFRKEVKQPPALPPKMATDLAASEKAAKTEEPKTEEPKPVEPAASPAPVDATAQMPAATPAPADSTAKTPAAPPEKQAAFTTPSEPAKKPADADDRYATPAAKNEPAMREPAPLETPPAKAIAETAPKVEPVRIANAPSFTAADVAASLAAANAAEAGLETGNLQDGKEVAHTKGVSYMAIADFAGKATFADAADSEKSQQEADGFFRKLLSNAHTRDEVAQIAPRWLSHPKRPQNGVFLAGNLSRGEIKGSVIEYNVELNGGPSVVVVVPAGAGQDLQSSAKPVAVVGAIVDKPADEIAGYTGKTPQVVFAKKLLPLE